VISRKGDTVDGGVISNQRKNGKATM